MDPGAEAVGNLEALGAVVGVVDDRGAVSDCQAGGVQTDASGAAADDEHGASWLLAEGRDDGAPGVAEVVTGGSHPQRVHPGGHADEHVVGVRDAQRVGDHATPGSRSCSEPVGRQGAAGTGARASWRTSR